MKNKSFFPILLLATIFVVSGCNNAQPAPAGPSGEDSSSAEPAKPRPLKRYVTIKLDASLRTNNTGDPYKLSFLYDDEYFLT